MDLEALRAEIDGIDDQLLALFTRRMVIVRGVAAYKLDNGLPVLNAQREIEIIARVKASAPDGLGDDSAALFELLMQLSRQMQEKLIEAGK